MKRERREREREGMRESGLYENGEIAVLYFGKWHVVVGTLQLLLLEINSVSMDLSITSRRK